MISRVVDWLKKSDYTTVVTGAGISTESGIPDFRSENGLWQSQSIFYVHSLEREYERFFNFCKSTFTKYKDARPNRGHLVLAQWEEKGLVQCIVTQNVDGLHQQAGNHQVYELHGNMKTARCMKCSYSTNVDDFLAKAPCPECGGKLRPDLVLFGDDLPEKEIIHGAECCRQSDLILVIGSSLAVSPACHLPFLSSGKKVLINKDQITDEERFDIVLHGNAGQILLDIDQTLNE